MQEVDLSELKRLVVGRDSNQSAVVSEVRFPPKAKWPFSRIVGVRFESVDFNTPILGGILSRPVIVDCEFLDANFDGINCVNAKFKNTAFRSSVFGRQYVGSISKTIFCACEFENCEFMSVEFSECDLSNCEFSGSRFKTVNFRRCDLAGVVIDGALTGVNFIGCSMQRVDLSSCSFVDSTVLDAPNQDVLLPNRPDNFLATSVDFENAKSMLRSELSAKGFNEYCAVADFVKRSPFGELVDEGLFEDLSNAERATVMRVLFESRTSVPG